MLTTTTIGAKEEPYPMVENVWDFYSAKGTKTVFVSVGTGNTCLPDLDFAETLGCKILKCDVPSDSAKWNEIVDLLKTRKVSETSSDFAKSAAKKWVLPKNIVIEESIPSLTNGTIEEDGQVIKTKKWTDLLANYCTNTLGLSSGEVHVDILKIDSCPYTAQVLTSLWQAGFRPSLLLVHWQASPNEDLPTMNLAAHLQMLGYALVGKESNKYLYYFTDTNYYELCSWDTVAKRFENPLMRELIASIYPGSQGSVAFPKVK